ncbi:MAG: FHA domain-containing protein [Oscillospiraceae bacterium]|nr:FHA domain-containing protein [Oscillospiraceae bacterium]
MPYNFFYSNPLEDLFDSISSGLNGIVSGSLFLFISMVIILILVFAIVYFLRGYSVLSIGRKVGISEEFGWMAFVPFAQAAYRQRILGEPDWKLLYWTDNLFYALTFFLFFLFLGTPFLASLLIFALLYLGIGRLATLFVWFVMTVFFLSIPGIQAGYVIYTVVVFLYLAGSFGYRFVYTKRLYRLFNINPLFAMHIFVPFGGVVGLIFDYMIAFSGHYVPTGAQQGGRARVQSGGYGQQPGGYGQQPGGYGQQPGAYGQQPGGYGGGYGRGSIVGVSGMYRGTTIDIPVGEEIVIGRDSLMAHIIIDQDADRISRKHCGIRFNPNDGMYSVIDYSTNGTFREDGSRLLSNVPVSMPSGTVIIIGSRNTSFRLG